MKSSIGSLAALAALSAPVAVNAVITNSLISNIAFPSSGTTAFDIDNNGFDDGILNAIGVRIEANGLITNGGGELLALSGGYIINSSSTYDGQANLDNDFLNNGTQYAGIQFDRGGNTHYGWLQINFSGSNFSDGTLVAAAWESDPNTAILAGATAAVPEPAETAVALGLFATLAAFFRRRFRSESSK